MQRSQTYQVFFRPYSGEHQQLGRLEDSSADDDFVFRMYHDFSAVVGDQISPNGLTALNDEFSRLCQLHDGNVWLPIEENGTCRPNAFVDGVHALHKPSLLALMQ